MKLTDHQKRIVDKIIDGEVFDIPSYLKVFQKGHKQQYDPDVFRTALLKSEKGMTYFVREEDHNFYTIVFDAAGTECDKIPIDDQMTYQFKEYPSEHPIGAELDMKIHPESVSFGAKSFAFNFLDNAYFVADSFFAIKDFVALWSYLRREALVFEGNKPVTHDDISIFFEQVEQGIHPTLKPHWDLKIDVDESQENVPIKKANFYMVPKKSTNNYIKNAWKLNQDYLSMCHDFIGVKMMATSELLVYRQKGYKTVEERSQRNNLVAAWVAVFISLVSVFIGNIMPLFQKADADYLEQISQQIAALEDRIDGDTSCQDILTELNEIHDDVTAIMEALDQDPSEELISAVEDIATQIGELNRILEEGQNNGQGTK